METLKDYFSYENDIDEVSGIFENLSRQLKIIHSKDMYVPNLSSKEIIVDDDVSFENMTFSENIEADKRKNILSLAKIMIGTYLSINTGFKDFSSVDDKWFLDNLDSIFETINVENFDKDYFSSIFLEGNNTYYSEYLDRKRQGEVLQGTSNVQGYRKVLRNAGSSLYQEMDDQIDIREKNANLQTNFNPLLIGFSLAVITVLVIAVVLIC